MTAAPTASEQAFRWPVRVYYEDTDAAGVVYYANYLRFLERARAEWLAALGFSLAALRLEHRAVFVVHRVEIDFHQPARLGDVLELTLQARERGAVRLVLSQEVWRERERLVSALVRLACIDPGSWRPQRIPAPLAAHLESAR